jgi:hypothetical protein
MIPARRPARSSNRAPQDQAALSCTSLLRQASGEGLSPPLESTAPRGAFRGHEKVIWPLTPAEDLADTHPPILQLRSEPGCQLAYRATVLTRQHPDVANDVLLLTGTG